MTNIEDPLPQFSIDISSFIDLKPGYLYIAQRIMNWNNFDQNLNNSYGYIYSNNDLTKGLIGESKDNIILFFDRSLTRNKSKEDIITYISLFVKNIDKSLVLELKPEDVAFNITPKQVIGIIISCFVYDEKDEMDRPLRKINNKIRDFKLISDKQF